MNSDKRCAKVIYNAPGGAASKNAITNRITIPVPWIKDMGITRENREVLLVYDRENNRIIVTKYDEKQKK